MRGLGVILSLAIAGSAQAAGLQPTNLQAIIDAAAPGATIDVPAGVYSPIKTDKPIKLVGHDWPVIDGGGMSDCVVMLGDDSSLSGFIVRHSGDDLDRESTGLRVAGARVTIDSNRFEDVLFGIDLKTAAHCTIRNNHIGSKVLDIARRGDALRLFRSDNCLIEANTFENGRDALLWYSNHVTVRNNVSRHNRYGFHMMYANDVTLENNQISDNSVGIYLMYGKGYVIQHNQLFRNRGPSGYGIGLKEVDQYDIHNNVLDGNRVGLYIDGSPLRRKPGQAMIHDNAIAFNDVGLTLLPSVKGNRIGENIMAENVEQVAVLGRGGVEGNDFSRNYWSDFAGYDANHDGVGDQPYVGRKLFEVLADREPKLRLMQFSPAQNTVEFIGKALPAVQPEAKFSDPSPLTVAPKLDLPQRPPAPGMSNARSALLLILGPVAACYLVMTPRRRSSEKPKRCRR